MTAGAVALSSLHRDRVSVRVLTAYAHILVVSADEPRDLFPVISEVIDMDIPREAGSVRETGAMTAYWLSPRSWLLRLPKAAETGMLNAVSTRFPDHSVHATPYSDAMAWMEIAGPDTAALLARGGFVSLARGGMPAGRVKRTLIADTPVLIWRLDADRWQIGVERSRAAYFGEWIENTIAIGDEGSDS